MRILVLSDTHGEIDKAYEIYHTLSLRGKIDLILHGGDYERDCIDLGAATSCPTLSVKGNCDSYSPTSDYKILETEAGKILLTHGHDYNVDFNTLNLYYKAKEEGCIGAIYGHTHKAFYKAEEDFFFLNPGSLTRPRDDDDGSFAILITGKNMLWANIYRYNEINGMKKEHLNCKKNFSGGHLVEKINYSDRF